MTQAPSTMERWLYRPRTVPRPDARLFCFPFAGGGAAVFRNWPRMLPPGIEMVAIRPPGRETRIKEPPYGEIVDLAADVAKVLEPLLDRPFALFGHSMGAMVAFELARDLHARGGGAGHLFVSARRAPTVPEWLPAFSHLPEDEFLAEVRERYGDLAGALVEDPEARRVLLPCLRADVAMVEAHEHKPGPVLECPITAFTGIHDRSVRATDIGAWRTQTSGPFRAVPLPGDHFFLERHGKTVVDIVTDRMQGMAR